MREHLGEEFAGLVSSVTSFGLFVTLESMYVEGLVHITELGGEYFRYDEARQELRGERTGIRYALGTRVQVQVSRVDLDGRRIDFRLVRPGEEGGSPNTRDKSVGSDDTPVKKPRRNQSGAAIRASAQGAEERPSRAKSEKSPADKAGKPGGRASARSKVKKNRR